MTDPAPAPGRDLRRRLMTGLRVGFPAVVSVFVLIGCIMLFAEMMIGGHTRGEARIGIVFAILGIAVGALSAAVVGLRIRIGDVARVVVVVGWLALTVGGLIGTWQHVRGERENGEGGGDARIAAAAPAWLSGDPWGIESERDSDGKRPPLAPLSFTGLGLLGALAFILGTEPHPIRDPR